MSDSNASARYAAQRAILDNVIGDEGVDSLRTLARTTDAIKAVVLKEIGRLYVSSEDAQADEGQQGDPADHPADAPQATRRPRQTRLEAGLGSAPPQGEGGQQQQDGEGADKGQHQHGHLLCRGR